MKAGIVEHASFDQPRRFFRLDRLLTAIPSAFFSIAIAMELAQLALGARWHEQAPSVLPVVITIAAICLLRYVLMPVDSGILHMSSQELWIDELGSGKVAWENICEVSAQLNFRGNPRAISICTRKGEALRLEGFDDMQGILGLLRARIAKDVPVRTRYDRLPWWDKHWLVPLYASALTLIFTLLVFKIIQSDGPKARVMIVTLVGFFSTALAFRAPRWRSVVSAKRDQYRTRWLSVFAFLWLAALLWLLVP
jgi:hypothetical protein